MGQRILVADDEGASRKGLKALLANWGYEVEEASNGEEALQKAAAFLPAVIILTGHGTIETAVAAMKQGAYDYLTKPVDVPRLRVLVQRALEKGEALREVTLLRRRLKEVWGYGKLVGKGKAMQEVYRLIDLAG